MEIIETQEIEMEPGTARIQYLKEGVVDICYYLTLFGKPFRIPVSVSLHAASMYVPGEKAFLKHGFYNGLHLPSVKDEQDQLTIDRFNSFVDEHGQAIFDKARELGLMEADQPE